MVSGDGIKPQESKIAAVKEMSPPATGKQIRGFLAFVGYYRRFIENFSKIARPLNNLLHKNTVWTWTEKEQTAFETLRDRLITAPILANPDYEKPFIIRTDASTYGLGAALIQETPEGGRRPVAYASRTLRGAELNYAATDLEALGMKFALKQFRPYVHGRAFVMETDHIALTWLRTINHSSSRRLMRTAMEMQDLQMTIVYKPGLSMHDADALSRLARELPGTKKNQHLFRQEGPKGHPPSHTLRSKRRR